MIKKYMTISIMAGSQALQVLSFFDYQAKNYPKTIHAKVSSEINIRVPLSNLVPTENILRETLILIKEDLERRKIVGPLIITTGEDEVKIDESIEFDLRENRVIGFAVDTFTSDLKDVADDPKDVDNLEELVMNGKIVPADLAQTVLLLVSLPDNSLLSYPLCEIGRTSRFNNSYIDFLILVTVTTVVSQ